MKKILHTIIMFSLALFMLCGCTSQSAAPAGNAAYKEYKNTFVDENGFALLKLYDDKTFELNEVNGAQTINLKGTYQYESGWYIFSGFDPFENINGEMTYGFELQEIEPEILKSNSDIIYTFTGDYFTPDGTIDESYIEQGTDDYYLVASFTHEPIADVKEDNLPSVFLYSDGVFEVYENLYSGMGSYYGTYVFEGDDLVCTVKDAAEIQGFAGQDVTEIRFTMDDNGDIRLLTDLCMSQKDDVFVIDYYYGSQPFAVYQRENKGDVAEEYNPKLEVFEDSTFVFTENLYAGMGHYRGTFEVKDGLLYCHVDDASEIQGFAGQDVKDIIFDFGDEEGNTLILQTDLCMSLNGDVFSYQQP